MTVDVTTEIEINRPIEAVASFASDPDNVMLWYKNIHTVEWQTQRPLKIGSKVAFVAKFMGRQLSYTYEFVDIRPNQSLTMRTSAGPFPMQTSYTWRAQGNATIMTLTNRGEPTGFSKLIAPLMTMAMRKATQNDLARLKALLEQQDV
ncbi:MAG TPA: ATPase [Oceanospirillaceae bacterium]|nr:ATPase [Oceanospirillaceae bacterium]